MRRLVSSVVALGLATAGLICLVPQIPSDAANRRIVMQTAKVAKAPTLNRGTETTATTATCSSTPFRSKPSQRRWFRIPAVVRTGTGSLVAFAERRDTDLGDVGNFDVVTTRSTDDGCNWSPYAVIGNDAGNRVSNPVPIVDRTTGDLLLFSVVTPIPGSGGHGKGLYLQTSSDDGRTFSPLFSHPVHPVGQYRGGLTGPGHGLQLSITHSGRLILPLGYRTAAGAYGAYCIYSDDDGATWRTGFDQQDPSGKVELIEGTIAELPNGNLFISFRNKLEQPAGRTARLYAVSVNGGLSLIAPFAPVSFTVVSVQGSALALTGPNSDELLFSSPADPTPNLRRDMTIFVSQTSGATWSTRYQVELEDTPGAYSDLVQLDEDTIGVIYETGTVSWRERIAYQTISVPALMHPALVAPKVSYQRPAHPVRASAKAKIMVKVTARGITSPPGRVTLGYVGKGRTGAASADLTYSNRGVRWIALPKLGKGKYRLTLSYSGTIRIKPLTRSAGTLRVIAP